MQHLAKVSGLYPDDPTLAAKVDAAMTQETHAYLGPLQNIRNNLKLP